MKNRQTGEKRRKEMRRQERQRDKADRRASRRRERTLGEGSTELDAASPDGVEPALSVAALSSSPLQAAAELGHALGGAGGAEKPLP